MLATRTRKAGTKPGPALSVALATRQVRRHVDAIMPGVMATVDSRLSHDLDTDTPTVVTTVTFPAEVADGQIDRLASHLSNLSGYQERHTIQESTHIVVTRTR